MSPDPKKVEAVSKFPVPRNPKDVNSFLGLAGYYRKFIKQFSAVAKPLNELLKKDVIWKWTSKEQQSFDNLKEILTSSPVLQFPDFLKVLFLRPMQVMRL